MGKTSDRPSVPLHCEKFAAGPYQPRLTIVEVVAQLDIRPHNYHAHMGMHNRYFIIFDCESFLKSMDDQSDMTEPFDSFLVTKKHDPCCIAMTSNVPHFGEVLIIYLDPIPPAASGAEPTANPTT